MVSIIDWICSSEPREGTVRLVNDLELVFALLQQKYFCFPLSIDGTLKIHMRRLDSMFQRPTVTMLLRPVQTAIACLYHLPSPAPDADVHVFCRSPDFHP